ncbi:lipopolysaccharide biosynthesis protein [Verrucosispora sioxanthis]|uniref:Lipopolysaccharide biosynthesis protein n=1 Tax=Verrucosispora sioxanthis TaxID=2499994 RepID=A0A6M1L557_9ACTN|nr:lipopolysaccharide biosynthesis protein [Verrucosispora sioxanthis]NEE62954.1 lipopolysaccharide biosynthesis protein [Verrucosispora sioxanthis]NGM12064.1 lipopolysaccharide biosynthesis protein [Verrucosispora sioxanthis]
MYLARYFGAHWATMALLALLGGIGAGALAASQPASYRSEVQLLVSFVPEPPDIRETAAPALAEQLMQRRVKTYASMMNSARLTQPVIDSLGLPDTPAQLADRIVASSTVNTLAIDVAVTYGDPAGAAAIVNALAAELQRIAERDAAPAGLVSRARVSVLKVGVVPKEPEAVPWPWHAALGALGGFAIGIGIAVCHAHRRLGTPVSADLKAAWAATVRTHPFGGGASSGSRQL